MSLTASLRKHKLFVAAGLTAAAVGLYMAKKKSTPKMSPMPMQPSTPSSAAHAMIGYAGPKNPGLDNLDNYVNWVAAGNAAGLDPSPYSYLTEKNENPLLSHMPVPISTGGGRPDFEHMKVQGSTGYTAIRGFTTYF